MDIGSRSSTNAGSGFSTQTADSLRAPSGARALITTDHHRIREWATRHGAEPATGEATASGPAMVVVNDGGVGIRFNFPGAAPFRPISWDEWLECFEQHQLGFVVYEDVPDRAYAIWAARGGQDGSDRDDWFEAERQLQAAGGSNGGRYRLIKRDAA